MIINNPQIFEVGHCEDSDVKVVINVKGDDLDPGTPAQASLIFADSKVALKFAKDLTRWARAVRTVEERQKAQSTTSAVETPTT